VEQTSFYKYISINNISLDELRIESDSESKLLYTKFNNIYLHPKLWSVITKDLEIIVYDVSLRVPGNPILATTSPYTKYQYGQTFGVGRRIAMEIKKAYEDDTLSKIVT